MEKYPLVGGRQTSGIIGSDMVHFRPQDWGKIAELAARQSIHGSKDMDEIDPVKKDELERRSNALRQCWMDDKQVRYFITEFLWVVADSTLHELTFAKKRCLY